MKNALLLIFVTTLFLAACSDNSSKKTPKKAPTNKTMPAKISEEPAKEETAKEESTSPSMTPEQLQKAKEIIANVSADDIAAVDAKKKFKMFCAACHGFTGDLKVNGAKDLTKSKITTIESVAQVYFGKGLMTPFKGLMSEAEIVALANYIEKTFMK